MLVSIKLFNCRSTFLFWSHVTPPPTIFFSARKTNQLETNQEWNKSRKSFREQVSLVQNCNVQLLAHYWKQLGEVRLFIWPQWGPRRQRHTGGKTSDYYYFFRSAAGCKSTAWWIRSTRRSRRGHVSRSPPQLPLCGKRHGVKTCTLTAESYKQQGEV